MGEREGPGAVYQSFRASRVGIQELMWATRRGFHVFYFNPERVDMSFRLRNHTRKYSAWLAGEITRFFPR